MSERPSYAAPLAVFDIISGSRRVSGSPMSRIPKIQGMRDWFDTLIKHNIAADIEVIPIQKMNEVCDRLNKPDVKYRFSVDMASLRYE